MNMSEQSAQGGSIECRNGVWILNAPTGETIILEYVHPAITQQLIAAIAGWTELCATLPLPLLPLYSGIIMAQMDLIVNEQLQRAAVNMAERALEEGTDS